ncbi:MAG TPA: hydrogenase assembly protein HypC [Candidatus Moranbacteria bacterium]|nr:hydrogenase assembly protein HypC [Candidatus Moranbacteria bacterium]
MCLAIPGKIKKIHSDQQATADFNGMEKEINISLIDAKVGDFVIVHAGFAIEKMEKEQAEEISQYLN